MYTWDSLCNHGGPGSLVCDSPGLLDPQLSAGCHFWIPHKNESTWNKSYRIQIRYKIGNVTGLLTSDGMQLSPTQLGACTPPVLWLHFTTYTRTHVPTLFIRTSQGCEISNQWRNNVLLHKVQVQGIGHRPGLALGYEMGDRAKWSNPATNPCLEV